MAKWETVAASHRDLTESIARHHQQASGALCARHRRHAGPEPPPAQPTPSAADDQTPAEARAKIEAAFNTDHRQHHEDARGDRRQEPRVRGAPTRPREAVRDPSALEHGLRKDDGPRADRRRRRRCRGRTNARDTGNDGPDPRRGDRERRRGDPAHRCVDRPDRIRRHRCRQLEPVVEGGHALAQLTNSRRCRRRVRIRPRRRRCTRQSSTRRSRCWTSSASARLPAPQASGVSARRAGRRP